MRPGITLPSEIGFSKKVPGKQSPSASDELVHGRGSHRQPACAEVPADGSGVRRGEWGLGRESGELAPRGSCPGCGGCQGKQEGSEGGSTLLTAAMI